MGFAEAYPRQLAPTMGKTRWIHDLGGSLTSSRNLNDFINDPSGSQSTRNLQLRCTLPDLTIERTQPVCESDPRLQRIPELH